MKSPNKNNPFKTPDTYFEEFASNLKDRLSQEALNLPKEDGFTVPKGYFDGAHANITKELSTKETKVVQLASYKKYYMVAASIAAVFVLALVFNKNQTEEVSWNDLANTDIENYFENNDFGLTSYEIAEEIPIDGLEIGDFFETQFSHDHISDYIDENIDDFKELNFEENE